MSNSPKTIFESPTDRFRQTLIQGVNILRGKETPTIQLQFIDPAENYPAGTQNTFWVPFVSLGRASNTTVQYGNNYPTVSRLHAVIGNKDGSVFIEPSSNATNPTFVNGQAISGRQPLRQGDEIRLSANGPRINVLSGQSGGGMGQDMKATQRVSQFTGQAVRPYRKTLTALGIVILLLTGGLVYSMYKSNLNEKASMTQLDLTKAEGNKAIEEAKRAAEEMERKRQEQEREYAELKKQLAAVQDELRRKQDTNNGTVGQTKPNTEAQTEMDELKRRQADLEKKIADQEKSRSEESGIRTVADKQVAPDIAALELDAIKNSIYFVYVDNLEVTYRGKEQDTREFEQFRGAWSGTAFLTDESLLVTARHVLQPWRYGVRCGAERSSGPAALWAELNNFDIKGDVYVKYIAVSSNGERIAFTSKEVKLDESLDILVCDDQKKVYSQKAADRTMKTDWAYIPLKNQKGKVKIGREKSQNLMQGYNVYGLCFSRGLNLQDNFPNNLSPTFHHSTVSQNKLSNGMINISQGGVEGGCSGGPFFYKNGDQWEVVGILSYGDKIVSLVPVSEIR